MLCAPLKEVREEARSPPAEGGGEFECEEDEEDEEGWCASFSACTLSARARQPEKRMRVPPRTVLCDWRAAGS